MTELDRSLLDLTGYRLRRTTASTLSRMGAVFAEFGLRRTTFSTLSVVVDKPGLRQSQIAQALAIERPNFVQIVDELEKAGLIERKTASDDRRANALFPTTAGAALCDRAFVAVRAYDQQIVRGLSHAQIETLHQTLQIIDANAKLLGKSDDQ